MLELFKKHGLKATFFLSFGPDNSGKAIWNIFKTKGFLAKMLRTGAPKLYGWRTMLYGTLLPAPMIASAAPEIVQLITQAGHEIGVHAWDHRLWQDHLAKLSSDDVRAQFQKSFEVYLAMLGQRPRATAAPGWYCNQHSLEVQDTLGLDYASDTRGDAPFYPQIDNMEFKTLQIPSNQPCIEELIGRNGIEPAALVDYQISLLQADRPNILPLHAEVEGGIYQAHFDEFIEKTLAMGFQYLTLNMIAKTAKLRPIPTQEVIYTCLPGRSGLVTGPVF